ncbi:conserved hypothetical protein [Beijerinckia indica subsp. indica ATCC 9039]|uniref:Disulphide bond formation protein DsbB n=1 Tax=Beijerinckia indica subsp. indica (strain ATCC 9039 / DSM 1715 / NCIMB 8712) TaxID=395963 RepID=B2IGZ4_BEII9|nr:conserved hypothetical protein [Beijerinckia indica subsp. indica ATCC 9039]
MSLALLSRPKVPLLLAIVLLASGAIIGAWIFQAFGVVPCELCLKERWPYYAGIPLGLAALFFAVRGADRSCRSLCSVLAIIFVVSALFGLYHAGVEWGFWKGPTDCTGPLQRGGSINDFWQQLQSVKVVRCDEAALRILGLSLAGWNAVISVLLAGLAFKAAAPSRS